MAAEVQALQQQQEQQEQPPPPSMEERLAWVQGMRAQFSPQGMCLPSGEIDQDFFKPKNIVIRLKEDEKWGAPQREALYKVGCRGGRRGS